MTGIRIEGVTAPPPTPSADAGIVAGLVAHDRSAVADLYDRYGDRLLGFCTGMLRDGHEAADALHDTILVAADRAEQLRDPERLRPWLYAIARTQCLARLRRRDRTMVAEDPTELGEGRPMTAEAGGDGDGARAVESGEAAELVWSAAEGLDEGDRVLLELQLRQGLQGAELAAAAGVRPGQISMATGRMRERLERALGALLVARHGRRDCPELDGILRDWDGRLTVVLRKRVARHVERCGVCDERRSGLVAPLGSLAIGGPVVLTVPDLRADLIGAVDRMWGTGPTTTTAPDVAGGWGDDGFPTDPALAGAAAGDDGDGTARSRWRAAAAAAAVLLLVAGLVAWRASARDASADEVRADAATVATTDGGAQPDPPPDGPGGPDGEGDDPTTTAPTSTTSPPATAPVAPTPTTASDAVAGPTGPSAGPTSVPDAVGGGGDGGSGGSGGTGGSEAGGGGSSGGGSTGGGGTGGGVTLPPTTAPPPGPRPPSITSVQVPTDLSTACGSPNTATVTVQTTDPDGLGGLVVVFRVEGPDGVQTPAAEPLGVGRARATIGPFSALGSVSVRVTVTDPTGLSDSETRSVPLQLAPC